jgi:hypothetical protein
MHHCLNSPHSVIRIGCNLDLTMALARAMCRRARLTQGGKGAAFEVGIAGILIVGGFLPRFGDAGKDRSSLGCYDQRHAVEH